MKRLFALVCALLMTINISAVSYAEGEIWSKASNWAVEELTKAQEKGIIPQILKEKDFTQKITREEFAEVSVKTYESLAGRPAEVSEKNPFTDTQSTEILKAYALGITTGLTETTFGPDKNLTREQASTMLSRAYTAAFGLEKLPSAEAESFADDAEFAAWAKEAVYYMSANSIIGGVGENRFSPKGSATREHAVLIAARMCEKLVKPAEPEQPEGEQKPEVVKEDYVIGFIGGSLTEGGVSWQKDTAEVFAEKYPDKNIVTINAGIGGTTSDYGATRYRKDILAYNPDVVFIEYSVNDRTFDEYRARVYMEAMVRQSLKAAKVPKIIFLHAPMPNDKDSSVYTQWSKDVAWKDEVAEHYGIKSINIYDYMYEDYTAQKVEKGEDFTFNEYLSKHYTRSNSGEYDVHGGYNKYGEAITKALAEDFDGYVVAPKNASVLTDGAVTSHRYEHIDATSGEMQYTSGWDTYTAANQCTSGGAFAIPTIHYSFPYYPNGIKQTDKKGTQFGYKSTPGAQAVSLSIITSTQGASAKVYVDGKQAGTVTIGSSFQSVNCLTDWIELPNDGKSHKVVFEVSVMSDGAGVFRFGSVVERFKK